MRRQNFLDAHSRAHALLDTGKVLAKGVDDEDVMFARPGPAVEYWEDED
jgi:hypothetical protein